MISVIVLQAGGGLKPLEGLLKSTSKKAVEEIQKKIQVDHVDIVFYESKMVIEHLGFGGHTQTPSFISIPVNPEHKEIKKSIKDKLPKTIAHELHHVFRNYSGERFVTLLEALINEGIADHFEIEMYGGKPEKWDSALSMKQIQKFLKESKKEWNNTYFDHVSWFFGSKEKKIPRWTGYSIGFYIISKYLKKHPDKKPSTLKQLKTQEVIQFIESELL